MRQTDKLKAGIVRLPHRGLVLCLACLLYSLSARVSVAEAGTLETFAYDDGAVFARLATGDVTVGAANPLINQGYTSNGALLETGLLDGRFSLTVGNAYGSDTPAERIAASQPEANNRRADLALDIGILRRENLELSMRGNLFDAAHPAETHFGSDERIAGEDNTVLGGGFDLSLLGGRLRHSSNFGWSSYARPTSLNLLTRDLADDAVRHDRAQLHEIEARLWEYGSLGISVHGLYRLVGPDYHSIEASQTSDRETREFGTALDLGPLSLSFARTRANDNVDNDDSTYTQLWITDSGALSFDLDDAQGPVGRFLPDRISLNASRERLSATGAAGVTDSDRPDKLTTEFVADLTWEWGDATTAVTLSHTRVDDRRPGYETADSNDSTARISQDFSGNTWEISGYLDLGRYAYEETNARSTEDRVEGGIDLSLQPAHLPDLTAAFDAALVATDSEVPGESGRQGTWSLDASLDISKFLPRIVRNTEPYARITFRIENDGSGSQSGAESSIDQTLFVSAGLRF